MRTPAAEVRSAHVLLPPGGAPTQKRGFQRKSGLGRGAPWIEGPQSWRGPQTEESTKGGTYEGCLLSQGGGAVLRGGVVHDLAIDVVGAQPAEQGADDVPGDRQPRQVGLRVACGVRGNDRSVCPSAKPGVFTLRRPGALFLKFKCIPSLQGCVTLHVAPTPRVRACT